MYVVFAGAGASLAVDKKQYPTTLEFFQQLPESIHDDAIFKATVNYLKSQKGNETPDIEEILWIISEQEEDISKLIDASSPIGWLLNSNRIMPLTNVRGDIHNPLQQAGPTFFRKVRKLIYDINEQIYTFYRAEPSTKALSKTWTPFYTQMLSQNPKTAIEVFTTNYDVVLEAALQSVHGQGALTIDGRKKRVYESLDLDAWSQHSNEKLKNNKYIRLTKLHGSVDWTQESSDAPILSSAPGFRGEHGKHVILYPGFKGNPEAEPFITFHQHFSNCIREAETLIFIGFAFRDLYINTLLETRTSPTTKIIVIDPSSSLPNMPFSANQVRHIKAKFNEESISKCISLISE